MKTKILILAVLLAFAGCAGPLRISRDPDAPPPSDEERLQEVIRMADQEPQRWSPILTIPMSPVMLAVDTSIKFGNATVRFIRDLLTGPPDDTLPVPERVEREANQNPRN